MADDGLRELQDGIDEYARQNLAFARELAQRKRPDGVAPTLWVHLVHGTWANPATARERPTWFEPGGSFETALRRHGDAAAWERVRFVDAPHWSGRNSFEARAAAADQLRTYFDTVLHDEATTFDRHVVIAHSHGGTVAVEALRSLGSLASEFSGLLTLGTPFVQRVRKAEGAEVVSFDSLTGLYAHAVAFFFAFTLALCLLFEGHTRSAAAATVVALLPWVFARIPRLWLAAELLSATLPLAASMVFLWVFDLFGPSGSLGTLFGSAVLALVAAAVMAPPLVFSRSVRFRGSNDAGQEDELPPPLKTELLAIRAPGDEASLAISAASAAVWFSDTLSAVGFRALGRVLGTGLAVIVLAMGLSLVGALAYPNEALWQWAVRVAWSWPFIVPMALLVLTLLLKSATSLLIALACGLEALQAPGYVKVYAEPLPRSRDGLDASASLRMVFPSSADLEALRRKASLRRAMYELRHAIYDYPSVQRYVAEWILDRVPGPGSPV